MEFQRSLVVLFLLAAGVPAGAQDLKALVREFQEASRKVSGGTPREREGKAAQHVAPVLKKIGALDNEESLAFLMQELENPKSLPEISAACAEPIAASSNPRALQFLLSGFARRSAAIQARTLDALGKTKRDIKAGEKELLAIAGSRLPSDVKRYLPGALDKLDNPAAAKALLAQVQGGAPGARGREGEAAYEAAVLATLKATRSAEVKLWLAREAFAAAGSVTQRLAIVARLAGELKIEEARPELEKLIGHASGEVAAAAVESIVRLGIGGSAEAIASSLEQRRGKSDLDFRIQALDALAAAGTEAALQVILRFAASKDPESRAVAMGSLALLAKNKSAEALAALLAGLEDEDATVRAVALRSLSTVREKPMIGALIRTLETQKDESFKVKALELLVNITDHNMGLVAADWRKWWDLAEARFEFPKSEKSEFTSVKVRGLDYFGIEISSKRVGFLVDISSSMNEEVAVKARRPDDEEGDQDPGQTVSRRTPGGDAGRGGGRESPGRARKIDILKRELVRVIRKLSADTHLNIVCFHGSPVPWQKELQPVRGNGRDRAISYVQGLSLGTGTNVFDTLELALQDKRVDTVYLLTDGLPTRGRIVDQEGILREVARLNRVRGITIHCIAFGEESDLLKQLAAQNGGQYRFVNEY
jgi:hypothetical protein